MHKRKEKEDHIFMDRMELELKKFRRIVDTSDNVNKGMRIQERSRGSKRLFLANRICSLYATNLHIELDYYGRFKQREAD